MVRSGINTQGTRGRCKIGAIATTMAAFLALCATVASAQTAPASSPADDQACLACHDSMGTEKQLASGERLLLTVRGERFANSVHGWVGCAGCHVGVDLDTHPSDKRIKNRSAYSVTASQICLDCHAASDLAAGPAHHARVSAASGPACSSCHDPHSVTPVADWKSEIGESGYCLACHRHALSARLENGETLPLSVEPAVLRDSVHPDHDCTDCHSDFSRQAHTVGASTSTRERVIALAEVCRKCHAEKFEQYSGSIHATLIRDGNLAAPVCSDCHGAHAVRPRAVYETVAGVPCKKCHANIFDAYVESMHGKVRGILGHFEAPICADCHRAHDVDGTATGAQLREACLGCHTGAVNAHERWLPNAGLHLEAVSCPACHAPLAQRRVELRLFDATSNARFSDADETELFVAEIQRVDKNGDGLDAFELWTLVRNLSREGKSAEMTLQGRVAVRTGADAHRLSDKTRAVRECVSCHRDGADPFQSVTVSIVGPDGRTTHYNADKDVLSSVMSMSSVGGFYAVGGTRIKLLDLLLVVAFLAGLSVPVGHLTLKWLHARFRKGARGDDGSGGA